MIVAAYFWRIDARKIPFALLRMALDRRVLRRSKGVTFAKLLGCGKGETFTPADADPRRWGFLICIDEDELSNFDQSRLVTRWRKNSTSEFRALLETISSHGKWSNKQPFIAKINSHGGQVVAITRARIKWWQNFRFWKAVPPVTSSLKASEGLISAIGIGEAPIGLQGTFSLWQSSQALKEFAYNGKAHQSAIMATQKYRWYSEELFARFAVKEIRGRILD